MAEIENHSFTGEREIRGALQSLTRRKWMILSVLVVTAAALGAAFSRRTPFYAATCLASVKKPSQIFVVGKDGTLSNASVPLLEGATYRDVVNTVGFATRILNDLERDKYGPFQDDAASLSQRVRAEYKDPDLLKLTAQDLDRDKAISLANDACQTLIDLNQAELQDELEGQVKSITQLLGEAGKEVDSAQATLTAYMQQEGLVNVDFNSGSSDLSRALQLITKQEMSRAEEEAALQAANERMKELTRKNGKVARVLDFPVEDPALTALRSQVEEVRKRIWAAQEEYTDAHSVVQGLRSQLTDLEQQVADHIRREFRPSAEHELAIHQKIVETKQEITSRKAQIAAWTNLMEEQRRVLGAVPHQRAKIETLKLSVAFTEERYRTLSQRLDEARINLGAVKGNISIVQPAVTADPPSSRPLIMVAALLLFSLPLAVGLLVDYMDDTVQSPAAFGRQTGLPCLAVVPKTWRLRLRRVLRRTPLGSRLAAFRTLRLGLYLALKDSAPRRIAIVGARKGEGRSTLVLNIARVLADDRKKVTVVDADLRHASLASALRIKSRGGLVEVLAGELTLSKVLHQTTPATLVLLPAKATGRVLPPNVEMLFRSHEFKQIVDELSFQSDIVLFDTPPVLEFPDVLDLLAYMDGVIVVAEAGSVSQAREDVLKIADLIGASGVKGLGVVLNKARRAGW